MISRITISLFLFVLFAFFSSFALMAQKGVVHPGKEIFNRCAVCHGESGEGKEAMAKMFDVKMPVFNSKEIQSMDNAAIKKVILEGKGKMPPVSNLTDQQVSDVIAFIRTLSRKK
jgi:mono/diheme cytochrome c family protein